MKNYIIGLLFLALFCANCQSDPSANQDQEEIEVVNIQESMLGTWEVKYLKVEVESYQNEDTSFVFEIQENQWNQVYGVRPFRTFFSQDSTFRTMRRSLDGQEIGEDRGLWRSFGDTLMMIQPNAVFQYKVEVDAGQAQWAGVIDWDYDGQDDDTYFATYRYVGKTSNE